MKHKKENVETEILEEQIEISEEEKQILVLKEQIKSIRSKGKFKTFYKELRVESYAIFCSKKTDSEKKKDLIELIENIKQKIDL